MKKIYYILIFLLCIYVQSAKAQMGVNSTGAVPNAAAMLDVRSSDKGFLMPRMTTTQRNAMPSIADGLMIYNTTTAEIEVYRGLFGWQKASRMGVPFSVSGSDVNGIVQGYNTGAGSGLLGSGISGPGVYGTSSTSAGVSGNGDKGVFGNGTTFGVYGSSLGTGVFGETNAYRGVWGRGLTTGDGVYGDAISGKGVYGLATGSGTGVYGNATAGGTGVQGISISGNGGYFQSDSYRGLEATSLSNYAILANNNSATVPVAQFANLSGGIGLEVIAATALKITGAIKVAGGINAQPAFKITSVTGGGGNTVTNQIIIPNTTYANNANDILIVTHNFSPNNTYLNKNFGVYWESITSTWRIYLEEGPITGVMPNNITFNVLVIKQ